MINDNYIIDRKFTGNGVRFGNFRFYDISRSSFFRCSAPYGGGFFISQGTLDVSHLLFDECWSTGSYDELAPRLVGGASFAFRGDRAFSSCVSCRSCFNLKSDSVGIVSIAALDRENKSTLISTFFSGFNLSCYNYLHLQDLGNQRMLKANQSYSTVEYESCIHLGHGPFLWAIKDVTMFNNSAPFDIQGGVSYSPFPLNIIERSNFINSKSSSAVLKIQTTDCRVSDCSFIDYNKKLCDIEECNISFFKCKFSHFSETWPTENCDIGNSLKHIIIWGCFEMKKHSDLSFSNFLIAFHLYHLFEISC